jgi:glucose-1-phosphate adenylyltransferase
VSIKNALIADGCRIGDGTTIEHSIIGVRSQIGKNVTIRNSIIMGADNFQTAGEVAADHAAGRPPIGIGDGTRVEGAIVDKNCRIGAGARICNESGSEQSSEVSGAMIAEGIIIVVKDAVLPNDWRMPPA